MFCEWGFILAFGDLRLEFGKIVYNKANRISTLWIKLWKLKKDFFSCSSTKVGI